MKPGWRRLLQVNPSCSSSLGLGLKICEGQARGTADGSTWAQGRPCCISSAELQHPKDQTGPPGHSWALNRIRTQSMYLGLNSMSVSI